MITITKRTANATGWWIGKIGDRTGTFPSNYVEVFSQGQVPDVQNRVHFDNQVGVRVATFSQIEQPSTLYYGVPLEDLCQHKKRLVPKLITDCIEAVELYGMGLGEVYCDFRTDGNETLTDDLKAGFNQDPESTYPQRFLDPKKIEYVIKLLKEFIWQLPGLLVPRETLARFVRASQIVARQRIDHFGYEKGEGRATTELQVAIRELPPVKKNVFEFLVLHFKRVADKAYQNNMTSDKLAAALAPCFKGGVDSGAGPKLPLADLTWALEYIIRRGDFWFRGAEKPADIADDVKAAQPTCTVCLEDFTLKEATTEEGLRALSCGHIFHHDCIGAYLGKHHRCPVCKAVIGPKWDGLKDRDDKVQRRRLAAIEAEQDAERERKRRGFSEQVRLTTAEKEKYTKRKNDQEAAAIERKAKITTGVLRERKKLIDTAKDLVQQAQISGVEGQAGGRILGEIEEGE